MTSRRKTTSTMPTRGWGLLFTSCRRRKPLGGKGRLTQDKIKIATYYGYALRNHPRHPSHAEGSECHTVTYDINRRCPRPQSLSMEPDTGTQGPAPQVPASMPDMSTDEMIEDLRSSGVPILATTNFVNFPDVDSGTVACARHNDEETDINVLAPLEDNFNSEESIPCAARPLNVGPNTLS